MASMKQSVIFDLDGTLALIDHRRHLVSGKKKDFHAFDAACTGDSPNVAVMDVYRIIQSTGKYRMVIFSGRSERVRAQTEAWLRGHGIEFELLVMRPQGNYAPDEELKKGWMETLIGRDQVFCIFDDRRKVVGMWREAGLSCFQVADGDF
ncbi:phosphatase domain-containing protein [Thauera sp. Sel9]|uniref:phosphatase domain-containing protein n=1 Tax=Thauera sp. Sel9 TaxID=2974299 RepID=UPI0021E13BE1|nr:hypothetical protein [Thauera sp. Sel9]MCV2219293.1 hypothetical protein [Thauera sp. Sel9]